MPLCPLLHSRTILSFIQILSFFLPNCFTLAISQPRSTLFFYHDHLRPRDTLYDITLRAENTRQLARVHLFESQDINKHFYNQQNREIQYSSGTFV